MSAIVFQTNGELSAHTLGPPRVFGFGVSIALGALLLCPDSPSGLLAVCSTLLVASLVLGAPCSWSTILSIYTPEDVCVPEGYRPYH